MLKAFNNFELGNDFHISSRFGSLKFLLFLSFVSILIIIFIRSSICFVFKPAQSFRQVTFVKKSFRTKKCLREEQTIPWNWRVVWPNEGKQKKTTKLFFFIFGFGFCHWTVFILSLFSGKRKVVSHTSQIRKPVDKRQKKKKFHKQNNVSCLCLCFCLSWHCEYYSVLRIVNITFYIKLTTEMLKTIWYIFFVFF